MYVWESPPGPTLRVRCINKSKIVQASAKAISSLNCFAERSRCSALAKERLHLFFKCNAKVQLLFYTVINAKMTQKKRHITLTNVTWRKIKKEQLFFSKKIAQILFLNRRAYLLSRSL